MLRSVAVALPSLLLVPVSLAAVNVQPAEVLETRVPFELKDLKLP
jgi:hypothetical protein